MMKRHLWVAIGLLVAGVGCSGSDESGEATPTSSQTTGAPASTPAPTTTVAPTTPPTVAATTSTSTTTSTTAPPTPGEVYEQLVAPRNCLSALVNLTYGETAGKNGRFESSEWPAVKEKLLPAYLQLSQADFDWASGLAAYDWPDDLQADIDKLIVEVTQFARWTYDLGNVSSWQAFRDFDEPRPEVGSATVVRAKLGIRSNLNSDVDLCKGILN